jgi:ABC-type cobalamin/Fe3+-siderophores transport system ATPase subunit
MHMRESRTWHPFMLQARVSLGCSSHHGASSAPGAEGERQVRQLLEVVGLQELQSRLALCSATAEHCLKSAPGTGEGRAK